MALFYDVLFPQEEKSLLISSNIFFHKAILKNDPLAELKHQPHLLHIIITHKIHLEMMVEVFAVQGDGEEKGNERLLQEPTGSSRQPCVSALV